METSNRPRVLCVDDEPQVIEGLSLHLRRRYQVSSACGGAAGLEVLAREKSTAVIISDMRMPEMDGAAFLAKARQLAPDAVRLLLTGQADLNSAIAAVNEGQIFRFLTKPCLPNALLAAVDQAAEQHRLITAERVLLEQTLSRSIQALTEVLSIASPLCFGRATRVRKRAGHLAGRLGLQGFWQVEVAAMLSELGNVALPAEVAEKAQSGQGLSDREKQMADRVLEVADELLRDIPRLEVVRAIIAACGHGSGGAQAAFNDREKALVEQGAQVLKAALDFDALEGQGRSAADTLEAMRSRPGAYAPAILDALASVEASGGDEVRELPLAGLRQGMRFAADVKMANGTLLIARGHEVTSGLLARIGNYRPGAIAEPVRVLLPRDAAAKP